MLTEYRLKYLMNIPEHVWEWWSISSSSTSPRHAVRQTPKLGRKRDGDESGDESGDDGKERGKEDGSERRG